MDFFAGIWHGLEEAFFMFWVTLWALVLGFALSGAVQAFASRREMRRALGDHRPATVAKASFFGVISSSCSYAAAALAKSLFSRGADFTSSIIFMVASTNLVVELGIVLWLLMGWQFALAEFVGGAIMIVLLGLVLPRAMPKHWIADAQRLLEADAGDVAAGSTGATEPLQRRMRSRRGWSDASGYTISDLGMLKRELVIGFLVAGFLSALVPASFWQSLFVTGHGFWSSLQNVILGPFLAIISFVCSIGNVPLAAALWHGGSSFGGVISFIFADLITLPLLMIYRKYYGRAITARLLVVLWAVMSTGGLAVEYLFRAVGIPEPPRPEVVAPTGFEWNYTTVLNLIALVGFGIIYWLYRTRDTSGAESAFAKDPVCGMQVEKVNAGASARQGGEQFWFCCDGCRDRFLEQQPRQLATQTGGTHDDH
jgi:uncharacterized protein